MIDCKCPDKIHHDHKGNPCPRQVDPAKGYICSECLEQEKNSNPLKEMSENIPE